MMIDFGAIIGARLRTLDRDHRWLARECGLRPVSVRRLIQGGYPDLDLRNMSDILFALELEVEPVLKDRELVFEIRERTRS